MKKTEPLALLLHIDYVPWDGDEGWDIETIIEDLKAAFRNTFNPTYAPDDIRLVDVEVV